MTVPRLTEEECMLRLTIDLAWSVEYDSLTGFCRSSNCDDHIVYKEGSIVHRKTCETGFMKKAIVEYYCSSNLAFNKSTSMSTLWTAWGEPHIYRSPLGVDGDTTQDKFAATCFVTDYEVRPWWRVDLGAVYRIHRVVIYNRLDSNRNRAHDLVLSVGVMEADLVAQYYLPLLFSTYPFTFISSTVAKFVQLEINATFAEHFHLCEVEVYGVPECGSLPNPKNGSVFSTDTTFGHYAEYTCNTGFILLGNSNRKCQLDGTWTGTGPTCEVVDCGPLTSPENGTVIVSGLTYLDKATYSCFTGFSLNGSVARICMSDGNWNSSVPSCNVVDCGSLSNPENGTVSMSDSIYMSTATYICFTGFKLAGSVTRTCMSDGNWNSSAPSCNFIDCGSLSNPANGTVSMSDSIYMSTATYSCFTGFSLNGSVTRICMSDGNWNSSAPSCNFIDCGFLSNPENGTVSMSDSTYMSTATYSCFTGFSLNGSVKSTCMSDGNWNSSTPSCNVVNCGSLSNLENGTVSMPGSIYMSTATYSCFTGFSLNGSVTRTCMSDGNWNSSAPSCNFVDCGFLSNPENGTVSMSDSIYMSTATYSCFTGFILTGSVTRTCMSDGNWNSSVPSCNFIDCGSLSNPENGTVSMSDSTYMSTATYSCFTGFNLNGSVTRICMSDGNWNSSAPSCNFIDCGPLSNPENGTVSMSDSTYMSTATYSCFTGFSLNGSVTRTCMSDGNWNSSVPLCNFIDCGSLTNPENGTVSISYSTYMSTATYSCFTGFSLNGSVTRICMSDGNWNSSAPSCNFIDCGFLSNPENGTVSMSDSTYMSTATYSCFTGFSLNGSVKSTCMSDGNWNSSAPSCNVVNCGSLSNPVNGTMSMPGSIYMSTATTVAIQISLNGCHEDVHV
ncbi:CUB and sushi domain-containing protein 1-like [Mercenaria mercenaria]|uniref:CUB and sushi domain-containing protein 1-like n=1 Tax=Mercenaria mercenaria TaxID=6596 RepID=UPI00234F3D64|nr:CUB and sushi domain-containing protein 1-like [Mercenaria mercenaria]